MRRSSNSFSNFHKDQSGAVFIWASVLILIIVALLGLALDGARYFNLNSNMQQIADAAALAGAKELDGSLKSMQNATNAATSYLKNSPGWTDPQSTTQIQSVKFFASAALAADDANALSDTQTGNQQAAYIKVTTVSRGVATTFARIFGKSQANTTATAIARVTYNICRPVQSFICNPWELSQTSDQLGRAANFKDNVDPGDLFKLGAGSGSGPGNWGFISPVDPSGPPSSASATELQQAWASDSQGNCSNIEVSALGPYTDTGADTGKKSYAGMNVRFDVPDYSLAAKYNVRAPVVTDGFIIAPGTSGSASCTSSTSATDQLYPTTTTTTYPVVKNKKTVTQTDNVTTNCSYGPVTTASDLTYRYFCNARVSGDPPPVDCTGANTNCTTNATVNSCSSLTTGTLRVGSCPLPRDPDMTAESSSWKFITRGQGPNIDDLRAYWSNHHSAAFPSGVTTRYGIYLEEVKHRGDIGYFDVAGWKPNSTEPNDSANSCSTSTVGSADRRLINVAVVDCNYWGITGTKRLPVITQNAVYFMTEQANNNGEFYAEFVNAYNANQDGGSIFQQVELVK